MKNIIASSILLTAVSIGSALIAAPAKAVQLTFDNISGNNAADALVGETQLFLDVTDATGGETLTSNQALFRFSNVGPAASSITQIYFEDLLDSLSSIVTPIIDSGAGVSFSVATGNLNLPSGNDPNVNFTEEFGVKPNNPVQPNGVNPGEWVSVLFNLAPGKTLQNVFDDLSSGDLRVGFHVQGFAGGGSEAFVNNPLSTVPPQPPVTSVPEPTTTGALLLTGLAAFGVTKKRKNSNNTKHASAIV
ncbi:MAG: hypothetical protein RLZZ507_1212 [Cyanobacteriota bacterium]|jgi:hypothetical protein